MDLNKFFTQCEEDIHTLLHQISIWLNTYCMIYKPFSAANKGQWGMRNTFNFFCEFCPLKTSISYIEASFFGWKKGWPSSWISNKWKVQFLSTSGNSEASKLTPKSKIKTMVKKGKQFLILKEKNSKIFSIIEL